MSRKLSFLNGAIASSDTSILEKQCLRSHRAIYFARKGDFARASDDVVAAKDLSTSPALSSTALRNLAEAVIDFYCASGKAAIDRSTRAYSLAAAGGLVEVQALSAAWLAHFYDSDHNIEQAAKFAQIALAIAPLDAHDARARAGLVVAQNLGIAGRPDLAAVWYSIVFRHANANGDELDVSALMFNRTMERVSCWRQSALQSPTVSTVPTDSAAAAQSAASFDALVGNHGLESLNPLLLAQISSLRGSYEEALDIYAVILPRDDYAARMQADFLADQSICLLRVGKPAEAAQVMDLAIQRLLPETHPDDRAATHSRAAILYAALGNEIESSRHLLMADDLWRAYGLIQQRMIGLFAAIPREDHVS